MIAKYSREIIRSRAVTSLEEAEGHQHSAGGHGVDANKCIPSRRGGPEFFWYIFNTNSCILMHCLAPKMGITSVFINRPLRIGGMKTFGRCCPMRPGGPKIEAESRERGGILGERQYAPPARRYGECCRVPQWGWGRSPDRPKIFSLISALRMASPAPIWYYCGLQIMKNS